MARHLKYSNENKEQFQKAQKKIIYIEDNKIQLMLEGLLNMRLDKSIAQDEYDNKAIGLKKRQYELNDQLKKINEADENYSSTIVSLLNICSRAPELFESSRVEQKRELIDLLFSNLQLRGKKLEYRLKKPFDALVDLDFSPNRLETEDLNSK
jgi:hypothetical protein